MSWKKEGEKDSIKAIHAALDHGINWIDTAPLYGFGRSEEIINRALRELNKKPLIFTKCGFRWNDNKDFTSNLTAKSIREEVEMSLKRLGLDVIDLYQIHWPNPEEQIEEAWETMSKLTIEGKIRYIGVSNHNVMQMNKLALIAPITSLQLPYNAITRTVEEEILPYCSKQGIGTIVYSPMASGLLTGKMTRKRIRNLPANDLRKNNEKFNEPNLSKNIEMKRLMGEIAKAKGCNTAEIAIAWTLKNPSIIGAIVGARNKYQVLSIIKGAEIEIEDTDMKRISEIYQS